MGIKKITSVLVSMLLVSAMLAGCTKAGAGNTGNAGDTGNAEVSAGSTQTASQNDENYDESKHIGHYMYWPDAIAPCPIETNTVTLNFKKDDVIAGSGKIGIYEKDTDKKFSEEDITDTDRCQFLPASDLDKQYTGWSSGTRVTIVFDKFFETGKSYYMKWDEGVFTLKRDSSIKSREITKADDLSFSAANYGLKSADGQKSDSAYDGKVGQTMKCDVLLDGDYAVSAKIVQYDKNAVELSATEFKDPSSTLEVKFLKAGTTDIMLYFYDKKGEAEQYSSFEFNVSK